MCANFIHVLMTILFGIYQKVQFGFGVLKSRLLKIVHSFCRFKINCSNGEFRREGGRIQCQEKYFLSRKSSQKLTVTEHHYIKMHLTRQFARVVFRVIELQEILRTL